MDHDGTHAAQLTTSDLYEVFPAWSPGGNDLAIASANNRSGFTDIKILTIKREARL
jgi:Tol biopolymer transport system component